jgi:hypothetical protein
MYVLSESVKCPCSGSYLAYMQMNIEVCFPRLLSAEGYVLWDVNTKVRHHNFASTKRVP